MSGRATLRLLALPVGAVALLLAGAASGVPGDAYTAGSTPTAVPPSSTRTYTVLITSAPDSVSLSTRAQVGIPTGFIVNTASVSATTAAAGTCTPATWVPDGMLTPTGPIGFVSPLGSENELCPGGVLTVSFSAQAPDVEGLYTWTTELRRDEAFALAGSQPTVQVDGTPPATTIDSGPAGPTNDPTPSFAFSANEGESTFQCSVDDGAFATCASPHTTSALADGAHTFEVRAIDPAGNVDETPASGAFTVDTDMPETAIGSAPLDPTSATQATFTFSSAEAAAFECKLDAGTFAVCTSPTTLTGLTEAMHTFAVRAIDLAGNSDPTPATHTWRVDTTPPQTSIDTAPPDPHNGRSPSIEFSANDAATFECALDGAAFAGCSSPRAHEGLTDGIHTFAVQATDLAGNVDPTPAEHTWRIDTVAPQATIDSGPAGPTNDSTPSFAFSASEGGSSFECRIDAGAFSSCTSPYTSPVLTGAHTFAVRALDLAGNVDPTPATRSFTVDTTAPQTTIDSGPNGIVTSRSATFTFSSEPSATFQCSLDGVAFSSCTSPAGYTGLGKGPHSFRVKATDLAGNADPTAAESTWTVTDPTISIGDVAVLEGDSGTTNASFTVSLSAASELQVSVAYATANGTAIAPADYTASGNVVTFAPGETTKTVGIAVIGDLLDEQDETFNVSLSSPVNATIANGQGTGTITNDDATPSLSIDDKTVIEGEVAAFRVTLSAASGLPVSVHYASANGTAIAPGDYGSVDGQLDFAPGQTSKTIQVTTVGDTLDEDAETYAINLSAATNAEIAGDGHGLGTIIDNDGGPSAFINDVTVVEGNSGTINATFSVGLSASSEQTVSVGYSTGDGTATAPADYASIGGNLVFAPGQTTKTLTVQVKGDTVDELDESFVVNLAGAVNADIADPEGAGKITDDDPPPLLSVGDVTLAEGDAGTSAATFTVTLNPVSGRTVTVGYATADGTATAPEDYESAAGTLTFEPGETTKTVGVSVNGDSVIEADETFVLNLSNVVAGSIVDGQGVGTIANDDAPPPPPPPLPPPPPAPDTTPPDEVRNVRVKVGDETATISWANPSDADFQGVSVRRIGAGKSIQNLAVYEGIGTTFTQRGLKNGSVYRYRIKTRDRAGNESAGVVVNALPTAALFAPLENAVVTAPPMLRWKAVRGATYYNVQLYRVGGSSQARAITATKILSVWPKVTRFKLARTWRYGGKRYTLSPGTYRWYVWPGLQKRAANKYGPMLGDSSFKVKAAKKAKKKRRR